MTQRFGVGRPPRDVLHDNGPSGDRSADVATRVLAARNRQTNRSGICNARLAGDQIRRDCTPDKEALRLLDAAAEKFALSVRGYQRMLRVARTIADLVEAKTITPPHIAEALSLRGFDC